MDHPLRHLRFGLRDNSEASQHTGSAEEASFGAATSRQRRRSIYVHPSEDDETPFSEDVLVTADLRGGQAPFVDARPTEDAGRDDVQEVERDLAGDFGGGASSSTPLSPMSHGHLQRAGHQPLSGQFQHPSEFQPAGQVQRSGQPQPEAEDVPMIADLPRTIMPPPPPGLERVQEGTLSVQTVASLPQPEPEVAPRESLRHPEREATSSSVRAGHAEQMEQTSLTQALRRSAETLDGIFPRQRTQDSDAFLATKTERKYKKKTQKAGAGMELHYAKETEEIQAELVETMKKEWSNWRNILTASGSPRKELDAMKEENPEIKVIPTRWVHTNKSEPNQPRKLKSRLVVRGDLEDSSTMRCDLPTASQTAMGLVFALSASRQTDLYGGDISAAFLQGSKLDRILVLAAPKEGIPGLDFEEEMFYLVSSTAYGTKDAPRGWFKNLDSTMKVEDFMPLPYEPAAYVLHHPDGSLAGL